MKLLIAKARNVSIEQHSGQEYGKNGNYFEEHILKVVSNVQERISCMNWTEIDKEAAICVAYLHDTVEDTNYSFAMMEYEFGHKISQAVDALTRRPGEMYDISILRACSNPISAVVKISDLCANIAAGESYRLNGYEKQRLEKYRLAYLWMANDIDSNYSPSSAETEYQLRIKKAFLTTYGYINGFNSEKIDTETLAKNFGIDKSVANMYVHDYIQEHDKNDNNFE